MIASPVFSAVLSLFTVLGQGPSASTLPTMEQVRARLRAYEARIAPGQKQDPGALAEIARMDLDRALASRTFDVWSQACGSEFVTDEAGCESRLLATLRSKSAPLIDRSAAGAALVRAKNRTATTEYLAILKAQPVDQLAVLTRDLAGLPEREAVPLLVRVLQSTDSTHQVNACKSLGQFDVPEVRQALRTVLGPPTPAAKTWNSCMVARARLREPDSMLRISGFSRDMDGEDLLDAAKAMVEIGNEQGDFLLRKLTRETSGLTRIRAAEEVAKTDPAYADQFVNNGLANLDPRVRAEALVLAKRLGASPTATVRSMLVDPDALVQLRAAELILDWVQRQSPR